MDPDISIITFAIIGATFCTSMIGFSNPDFLRSCLFNPTMIIHRKEYHRIVASALIHADIVHLAFNMITLHSFGSRIEMLKGPYVLMFIYLASILGGSFLSLIMHRHHEYNALGASGGVCGVLYAAIFLIPGTSVNIMFIPIPIPAWLFAILFVAFSLFGMRNKLGNIGHDAHIGGALVGLAVTALQFPEIISQNPLLFFSVIGLSLVLITYLYLKSARQQN